MSASVWMGFGFENGRIDRSRLSNDLREHPGSDFSGFGVESSNAE